MAAARCRRGFTLIELLVVVTLIAVIAGAVVLSIPSRSSAALQGDEARRLHARMNMAREEAVLRARTFGLRIESGSYVFMQRTESGWRRFGADHPLREHELPEAVRLELEIEETEIALQVDEDARETREESAPQIFLLSSGEVLPEYTLRVLDEDGGIEYRIDPGEERWITLTETR